jgi:hypothetical protein
MRFTNDIVTKIEISQVVMTSMSDRFSHVVNYPIQVLQNKFISASLLFSNKGPLRTGETLEEDIENYSEPIFGSLYIELYGHRF